MWATFIAWLLNWLKHNLARTIGVLVVGTLLIGTPILGCKYVYNKGFSAGYAKCIKDNPTTIVHGGTVNQIQNAVQKEPFAGIWVKFWFLKNKLDTTF